MRATAAMAAGLLALALAACGQAGQNDQDKAETWEPEAQGEAQDVGLRPLRFGCTDGMEFTLIQDLDTGRAELRIDGRDAPLVLRRAAAADGFAYVADRVRFHGKGIEALLQLDSDPERDCRATGNVEAEP